MSYNANVGHDKSNLPTEESESGIKDPKPLEYLFEKELINNQNKHIHLVDDFVPTSTTHYLTAKYYARHDVIEPEKQYVYRSFVERPPIIQHRSENHVYGWMPPSIQGEVATKLLSQLNFINAPKQRCYLTVFGEALQSDRITERPPFNGLRFHLQLK